MIGGIATFTLHRTQIVDKTHSIDVSSRLRRPVWALANHLKECEEESREPIRGRLNATSATLAMARWLLLTDQETMAGTLENEPLIPFKTESQPHTCCFGMTVQRPDRRR